MSTVTVPAAIAAIINALPGVVVGATTYDLQGFDPPKPKYETAELPAVYTLTGGAIDDWASGGNDSDRETRVYRVQVAVIPTGQGTPDQREIMCRPILTAVKAALAGRPHLGTADVERATVLGDSGIVVLPEYDGAFVGFEIRLQVVEFTWRTYADNE